MCFPLLAMATQILDEIQLRSMPITERFHFCENIIKHDSDASFRGEALWVVGEIVKQIQRDDPLMKSISNLFRWVLDNEFDIFVRHEACFEVGEAGFSEHETKLVDIILDKNEDPVVRHEAIEGLGLLRAYHLTWVLEECAKEDNVSVRDTALFMLARFKRLQKI